MFCNFLSQILCGLQANCLCLLYILSYLEFSFSFSTHSERKKMEKCSFYIVDFCVKMYHQFFQSYSDTPRQKAFLHPCAFVGNQKRILSWYIYIHLNWMKNSKLTNIGCREKDTTGYKMYRTKHLITDLNEKETTYFLTCLAACWVYSKG